MEWSASEAGTAVICSTDPECTMNLLRLELCIDCVGQFLFDAFDIAFREFGILTLSMWIAFCNACVCKFAMMPPVHPSAPGRPLADRHRC